MQQNKRVPILACVLLFLGTGCGTAPEPVSAIPWQPFDPLLLDQAQREGRPVMINFHADWCVPCLELEKYTLSDERVIQAAAPFLPLVVDWTEFESTDPKLPGEAGALQKQFEVMGLPTVLFLDSSGAEVREARVFGYVDPEDFLVLAEMAANPG